MSILILSHLQAGTFFTMGDIHCDDISLGGRIEMLLAIEGEDIKPIRISTDLLKSGIIREILFKGERILLFNVILNGGNKVRVGITLTRKDEAITPLTLQDLQERFSTMRTNRSLICG